MDELLYPFFFFQSILFLYWLILLLLKHNKKIQENHTYYPSVTVIIPAYNEEENIGDALKSLLASNYPQGKLDILVVDDGSTDSTSKIAKSFGVKVIRTEHLGKARALNKAIEKTTSEVIIVLDADTIVKKDSIKRIVQPLSRENVVISVGKMRARGKGLLVGFQRVEYAFVSELLEAHSKNGKPLPFFFGAFMAVKRSFLEEVGGFPVDTPGEDFDLFVEAMKRNKEIAGTNAEAITRVPEKLGSFFEQRLRWGKAGLLITWKHRKLWYKYPLYLYPYWPIYGIIGFPNLLEMFFEYIPWHYSHGTLLEYLLSWFTYYGPINSLLKLPSWGFPPLAVIGTVLGLLSLAVILWSWVKEDRKKSDLLFLFFLPVYGTFLMGFVLFLIIPYTFVTFNKKTFIR